MDLVALRKKWLAPLIFFQFYLGLSGFLFFFGPWPWVIDNGVLLGGYLIAAQIFIAVGYLAAWRHIKLAYVTTSFAAREKRIFIGIKFLKIALLVSLIFFVPTSLSRAGTIFPDILAGISNTGFVYNEKVSRLSGGNIYVIVEYFRILFSMYLIALYPLVIVYWSKLSRKIKIVSMIVIILNLCIYISTGVNKGIADVVVTLPWLMYLGVFAGTLTLKINRNIVIIGIVFISIIFLQFFGAGQVQRQGGVALYGVLTVGFNDVIYADTTNFISQLFSRDNQIIYESLTRYIGTGYYALSKCFEIDQTSTLGFGNSMFIARNADAIFSTDYFTANSFPGLLEQETGFGMYKLWHSIYPWLASDFGFVGTLLVMGMLSFLFALSWGRSLVTLSHKWITLSFLMLILFYYIPANNQVFQSGETAMGFIFLLASIILPRFLGKNAGMFFRASLLRRDKMNGFPYKVE